ncbi:MAG: metal ABC transporter permease, partial [Pseudomonas aeruginosa]|nr:metal ABC transporter permease [Pseudomonas aeruginosa]
MPRAAFWILLSGALILALSLGVRHGFGLFLAPMSADFGWGREVFAFAIALQNLVWGLAQPFTGALADRYGAARAVLVGGLLYALGLVLMGLSQSASGLSLSAGLLIGPVLGGLGTLVVVKRFAFFSEAVGHAALTGVAIGILLGEPYTGPYGSLFGYCLLFG